MDENLHMIFYRNLVAAALEIAPSRAVRAITDAGLVIERCLEPLVDEGYKVGLGSPEFREAADLSPTGLPLLLFWVLRRPGE